MLERRPNRRALTVAVIGALLAAAGAYLVLGRGAPPSAGTIPGGRAGAPLEGRRLPSPASGIEVEPNRDRAGERAPARAAEDPPGEPLGRAVRGRCVDIDSNALPGVRVEWIAEEVDAGSGGEAGPEPAATDPSGRFRLEGVPIDRAIRAYFRAEGFLPVSMALALGPGPGDFDLGTIVLARGVRLLGTVTDESGAPLVGVSVALERYTEVPRTQDPRSEQSHRGVTNAFGEFDLGPCLPGTYLVDCEDLAVLEGTPTLVAPTAQEHRVHLVVARGVGDRLLQGHVKSSRGEFLEGARVHATDGRGGHWRATTDARGGFRLLRDRPVVGELTLSAVAPGHTLTVASSTYPWGAEDAQVTLRRAPGISLEVLDDAGRGVPSYAVRIYRIGAHPLAPLQREPLRFSSDVGPDGFSQIPDLIEGGYWLRVEPEGREDLERSPFLPLVLRVDARTEERPEELRVVLPRRVVRRVRLVAPGQVPVPGCGVELFETKPEDRGTGVFAGAPLGRALSVPREALHLSARRSDGRGELLIHGPSDTPLVLEILGPGCMPKSVELTRLDGEGVLEIQVDVPTSTIVSVTSQDTLADIERALQRSPSLRFFPEGADPRREGQRLVLDSRAFSGASKGTHERTAYLPPGRWTPVLDLHRERIALEPFDLAHGQSHSLVLDLEPYAPAILEGLVLWGSEPLSLVDIELQQWVSVLGGQQPYWQSRRVQCDAAGRFRVECLPGKYRVLLPGTSANTLGAVALPEELELTPRGSLAVEFRVELGAIRLRLVDPRGRPIGGVTEVELRRAADSGWVCAFAASDAEGWTQFSRCEIGSFHLTAFPRSLSEFRARVDYAMQEGLEALEAKRIELGEVHVSANQTVELELTLPDAYFE